MGYFDEPKVLNESQNKMRERLIGRCRHLTEDTIILAEKMIDPEVDSGKIALKCGDCVYCVRDHFGYQNYRISDRSNCPSTCALNTTYNG